MQLLIVLLTSTSLAAPAVVTSLAPDVAPGLSGLKSLFSVFTGSKNVATAVVTKTSRPVASKQAVIEADATLTAAKAAVAEAERNLRNINLGKFELNGLNPKLIPIKRAFSNAENQLVAANMAKANAENALSLATKVDRRANGFYLS